MNELFPEPEPEFYISDNTEYKVEAIINSDVYAKKAERYLIGSYYLLFWKAYPEEKSNWESSFAIMHFRKIISTFYKNLPEKPTATSSPLNSPLSMAKPSVKPPVKPLVKQK